MRLLAGHGMGCMVGNCVDTEGQFELIQKEGQFESEKAII
jgi:hypothetical protein